MNKELYQSRIIEWEYCYCKDCGTMKDGSELCVTDLGICCSLCGSYDLEEPGWVRCPHHKSPMVKCPRSGRGIRKSSRGYECEYLCSFRLPK